MEGGQAKSKVHKEETREGLIFHMRLLILHIKIIKISILFCLSSLWLMGSKSKCTLFAKIIREKFGCKI